MQELTYSAAGVPVRDDFAAAHRRFWRRLASPGTWWTGAERVAIAAEVRQARHCGLCKARQKVLARLRRRRASSPFTPAAGHHDHLGALPDAAVDVIHRVVTDPGRLSRQWFQTRAMSLVPDEVRTLFDLSAAHYLPMGQVRDPSTTAGTLNRVQMELIAGRVSALRQCFY